MLQDKYGLGPGCYPKALAPRAPAHPFCRCRKSPRIDLAGSKVRHKPGADIAYLRSLPVDEAAKVAGGKTKLRAALKGDGSPAEDYERALLRARKADNGGVEKLSDTEKSNYAGWATSVLDPSYRQKHEFMTVGFLPEKVMSHSCVKALIKSGNGIEIRRTPRGQV